MFFVSSPSRGNDIKMATLLKNENAIEMRMRRIIMRREILSSFRAVCVGGNLSNPTHIQNSISLTLRVALRILAPLKSQGRESLDSHG